MTENCIFCRIVSGEEHAYIIDENELSMAILDINPLAKGHCLVIPKRHVPWWHDLDEQEVSSLFRLARSVSERIKKAFKPDFVAMYARGRRIPHAHIFLIPAYKGDPVDRFFNALEGFQESSVILASLRNELNETAKTLRNV
ncbi:MAG: HIT family protein [Candidatus Bathyarchaeota archaeon]